MTQWVEALRRSIARRRRATTKRGPADWRVVFRRRVILVSIALGAWVLGIEARLATLQIFEHADYVARAEKQHLRTIDAPAKRGDIIDRNGRVLATSADADTIYAVPSEIAEPDAVAAKLCTALADCNSRDRQALAERLRHRGPFAYVRRQASPDQRRHVENLNLDGIGFVKESRRFYPNKELASHLLGYVGIDNIGLAGLEAAYDAEIRGESGSVLVQTDARRHAFSRFERPPTAGSTVELTIDEYLQHVAERELHAGVVENHAAGGAAIVLDPHSGEILAMANEPTFNPNVYREFDDRDRRNRAVQDLYEPGSTFKVVTASAAIEEGVLPLSSLIDTNPGQIRFSSTDVVREDAGRNYGVLSFTDVIVKSSNIGAIKIGLRIGTQRLSRYVERFGFGHPVSTDFPGENPGIVWDAAKWTERALASVSMGYQVGVTPLQMVSAVGSIANGGELVEPRVIRAIYRNNGRQEVKPRVLRRTVSPDTISALTAKGRRFRATRSPGRQAPPPSSWVGITRSRTTTRRLSASFRHAIRSCQLLSSWIPRMEPPGSTAVQCRHRSSSESPRRQCITSVCPGRSIPSLPLSSPQQGLTHLLPFWRRPWSPSSRRRTRGRCPICVERAHARQ